MRTREEVLAKVIEVTRERMGVKESTTVTEATRFAEDLGADSLDGAELVMEFEDAFGVAIPDEQAAALTTVGATVDWLMANLPTE